jgi:hypothetical protein
VATLAIGPEHERSIRCLHKVSGLLGQELYTIKLGDGVSGAHGVAPRVGYWKPRQVTASIPARVQENAKVIGAADSGVLFFPPELRDAVLPKLEALSELNAFGLMPLIVAADLVLSQADKSQLMGARNFLEAARRRAAQNAHLWAGIDIMLMLEVAEARLLAAEDNFSGATTKLAGFEAAWANSSLRGVSSAVLCEAVRVYGALGNTQRPDELRQKVSPELRVLVF